MNTPYKKKYLKLKMEGGTLQTGNSSFWSWPKPKPKPEPKPSETNLQMVERLKRENGVTKEAEIARKAAEREERIESESLEEKDIREGKELSDQLYRDIVNFERESSTPNYDTLCDNITQYILRNNKVEYIFHFYNIGLKLTIKRDSSDINSFIWKFTKPNYEHIEDTTETITVRLRKDGRASQPKLVNIAKDRRASQPESVLNKNSPSNIGEQLKKYEPLLVLHTGHRNKIIEQLNLYGTKPFVLPSKRIHGTNMVGILVSELLFLPEEIMKSVIFYKMNNEYEYQKLGKFEGSRQSGSYEGLIEYFQFEEQTLSYDSMSKYDILYYSSVPSFGKNTRIKRSSTS